MTNAVHQNANLQQGRSVRLRTTPAVRQSVSWQQKIFNVGPTVWGFSADSWGKMAYVLYVLGPNCD